METTADAARAWSGAIIGELCAGLMDGLAASHRPPVDSASAEPTIARPRSRVRAQLSGILLGRAVVLAVVRKRREEESGQVLARRSK